MLTKTADIFLAENGIIIVKIFPQAKQDLPEATENLAAAVQAGNGERRPLLTDIRNCQPLTPEARRYYSGKVLVDSFTRLAILIDASPFGRTMGNVYLQIARPGVPTRLFTSEPEAVEWLLAKT
jgi:hypothetical protein